MGCPYCGHSLDGYVEYASTAYYRVQQGCCPGCGHVLSGSGISVGFKESAPSSPSPRKIHPKDYYENREKAKSYTNKIFFLSIWGSLLGLAPLLTAIFKPESIWGELLIAAVTLVYWLLSWGIAYIWYEVDIPNFTGYYSESDLRGKGLLYFFRFVNYTLLLISLIRLIIAVIQWIISII